MTPAQQEMQILRKYAAGGDLPTIAKECGVPQERVGEVAQAVGFQRGRAAELLRQREAALVQHKPGKETTVHVEPQPDTIEQQLLRAEAIPRLKTRAIRIRTLIDDLRRDLEAVSRIVEAERKVEQLRTQLNAATEELRSLARPAAQKAAAAVATAVEDGPNPKDVRTWAARNGITVAPAGKVPRPVVEQYLAAQQAEQVAA
ncbi:Lsr2 family DNA-binding protein [Dactylosporangium sp. CA-152071]|uniref:Lsr2 family DNA-binding protein n=1 Tax=Dactylosporangium sp. CA-152071 TaxID=3239933 RepID=UPI003D92B7DF